MARSLELDPDLTTARFQLGLLHLTAVKIEAADEVWKGLDALGGDNPLHVLHGKKIGLIL